MGVLGDMFVKRAVVLVAALVASVVGASTAQAAAPDWESSPVRAKWQALGGASFAGEKVGDEVVLANGIRWAEFSKYDIVITWRESAGAHWMSGAISRLWLTTKPAVAAATMDQVPLSRGGEAGAAIAYDTDYSVYYSDLYGAFPISGEERDAYWRNGSVYGVFGWPVSGPLATPSRPGGVEQRFSQAVSTFRQPGGPARWISGALRDKFREIGGPGGPDGNSLWLAYDQTAQPGNGWNVPLFGTGGIYWSPETGARLLDAGAYNKYVSLDGPYGSFGYPMTDTYHAGNGTTRGTVTDFARNASIYKGPGVTHEVYLDKAMRAEYVRNGGPQGYLDWPQIDPTPAPGTDGRYSLFGQARNTALLSGPRTGTHFVVEDFLTPLRRGGDVAVYGLPQTDRLFTGNYSFQQFERATLFNSGAAVTTLGWTWRDIWWQLGGTGSVLGMPISNVHAVTPDVEGQDFEDGWIAYYTDVDEWYWGTGKAQAGLSLEKAREIGTRIHARTYSPRN
ncbi:hypothetical protein [Lentzea sp. NBRC 102530]|uniref:LGFP repeat-containing protein n=1 Tax=Lentzea sp. NBRC 102530 TaxID=3032201 RepID=UPI0024A0AFD4|nr:hypothetical protein [Lentzea sp. NBRC 102530]GLY48074.1 hypothetical protein Lesp01_17300 [Lentzea sp. NBRC 102530]